MQPFFLSEFGEHNWFVVLCLLHQSAVILNIIVVDLQVAYSTLVQLQLQFISNGDQA